MMGIRGGVRALADRYPGKHQRRRRAGYIAILTILADVIVPAAAPRRGDKAPGVAPPAGRPYLSAWFDQMGQLPVTPFGKLMIQYCGLAISGTRTNRAATRVPVGIG